MKEEWVGCRHTDAFNGYRGLKDRPILSLTCENTHWVTPTLQQMLCWWDDVMAVVTFFFCCIQPSMFGRFCLGRINPVTFQPNISATSVMIENHTFSNTKWTFWTAGSICAAVISQDAFINKGAPALQQFPRKRIYCHISLLSHMCVWHVICGSLGLGTVEVMNER